MRGRINLDHTKSVLQFSGDFTVHVGHQHSWLCVDWININCAAVSDSINSSSNEVQAAVGAAEDGWLDGQMDRWVNCLVSYERIIPINL